jgi:hypothetical protein
VARGHEAAKKRRAQCLCSGKVQGYARLNGQAAIKVLDSPEPFQVFVFGAISVRAQSSLLARAVMADEENYARLLQCFVSLHG